MINNEKPVVGIIGAGRLGSTLAKQLLKADYEVKIANSKGPDSLKLILSVLLPGAQAATVEDVIRESEIIVLAIPLNKYKTLRPELFDGKIVIDAMNYWPATEGQIEEFESKDSTSSEYIQQYLPTTKVVKTFNHVAYNELEEHSLPQGDINRRAIVLAGNDAEAKLKVATLIDDLGFDSVDLGNLSQGKRFQPNTKLFNARYKADEI